MYKFRVFTLFPQAFPGVLGYSITGKALNKGICLVEAIDIRKFAFDKNGTVDDIPFGGGSGMVIKPDVLNNALVSNNVKIGDNVFYLSPRGKPFKQEKARELAKMLANTDSQSETTINLICGRYEGIDQRIIDYYQMQEISIGDFILSGGELAAMVVIDAVMRNLPGVLGDKESLAEESFGNSVESVFANLLEYPHYTRPANWEINNSADGTATKIAVPEVLQSGNHKNIQNWRLEMSRKITADRRPDLIKNKNS